jgi:hypothetical protein
MKDSGRTGRVLLTYGEQNVGSFKVVQVHALVLCWAQQLTDTSYLASTSALLFLSCGIDIVLSLVGGHYYQ